MDQTEETAVPEEDRHRHAIAASWRRCASYGLDRDAPKPAYDPDTGAAGLLSTAAAPVLDRLAEYLEWTETSIYVADTNALMIDRRCPDRKLARNLDERMARPGFVWSEETTGTTGLGTALETRQFTQVSGEEHYIRQYAWAVDAAAPIVHPITRRLYGALGITCPNDVDVRHLNVILRQAVGNISDRLYEDASDRERLLLRRFLEATRQGSKDGILLLNDRMMLTNPAAARLLEGIDNSILWEQAAEAVSTSSSAARDLRLRGEETTCASFARVDHGAAMAGVLVKVKLPADQRRPAARRAAPAQGAQRSSAAQQLDQEIALGAAQRQPVLVLGEPGSGKLHTAEAIHAAARSDGPLRVLDVALAPVRGEDELLRELASLLQEPASTVVVRHLESFGARARRTVSSLLEALDDRRPRIIATADAQLLGDAWLALFPLRIEVPRLRDRIDDLPAIVRTLMERHGAAGRMLPAALQALSRHDWVGNIRELEGVVRTALVGHRTADLTLRDLPSAYQDAGGRRRLTRIEQVERDALVRALAEAGGNRTRAAEIAGIGRATLYRKMRSYGLDLESALI